MNILLDYLFPITSIEPTPAASTAFLKQAIVIGLPKDGGVTPGTMHTITSAAAAATYFGAAASAEVAQLFAGGLSKVILLPSADLNVDTYLAGHESDAYTILISSDFADAVVTAADFGLFQGVVAVWSVDDTYLAIQAAIPNRSAWHGTTTNKGKNMFYAFGKLLSNSLNWLNQQYVGMPFADDVATLGQAEGYFDDRINFVISDDQFSNRLGLFVAGGQAIVAPYIKRNLQIDLQSKALQYISANQPGYTKTEAALLEGELKKVIKSYISDKNWIEAGTISVLLLEDNFVASGNINISEPRALWRLFANMRASL